MAGCWAIYDAPWIAANPKQESRGPACGLQTGAHLRLVGLAQVLNGLQLYHDPTLNYQIQPVSTDLLATVKNSGPSSLWTLIMH